MRCRCRCCCRPCCRPGTRTFCLNHSPIAFPLLTPPLTLQKAWLEERDLFVGAQVELHGRVFLLESADDFTLERLRAFGSAAPAAPRQ